ncbi:MAG: SDR family NAD(P)-dependent oxidoreductase, partial [Chloroflexi bacterium]|nr:SDR family NAD(P)-dependent oxidoreductase [Chloroflexota bacterium]
YPQDMLELDLDLEADLGVDTVKQAETFVAIREAFDIPRRDDLQLGNYPTLEHVIGFVREQLAVDSNQLSVNSEQSTTPLITDDRLLITEGFPRRVPAPTLRPSLDLCKPTGVKLGAGNRVIVAGDAGGVGQKLIDRLQKLAVTTLPINESLAADALEAQVREWLDDGPIQGVYWLPALDIEPVLEEMELEPWRELNRRRVKNLYAVMRVLYEAISEPDTFLVAATRLGGLHGYGSDGATSPLGGAVAGFAKAYQQERNDALVKVVDFAANRQTAVPADALIAETLTDPGIVEVGYWNDGRYAITLVEEPVDDNQPIMTLDKETVFVVTGAAGGITSAIVADLAAASGGTFYLLDLAPAPSPANPKIAQFRADKEALKQQLIAETKAAGERPTPVLIEKQIVAVEREEAALRAIEAVKAAGGVAHYRCVDLLDGTAVMSIVDEIREKYGCIDVLIHAAGVEISRALPDKDQQQFDLVFDVKADGFFNLLRAARGMSIGATVAFSSVAGRFGNRGQTDYSAANDLLCKISDNLRHWRPETRGIVIDWTAWANIGMATRGSVPKIMAMAGIDMLPPDVGVPIVRRELRYGGGEIVAAGALGILTDERDESGGLDATKAAQMLSERRLPLIGKIKATKLYGGLEAETTFDPKEQPFLYDHAMEGTPLLPGVMGTETFAQLAVALAPGYGVTAVANEQFHAPFKFYRMEPQTLYLSATIRPTADGDLIAHTVLRSRRELGQPGLPPQEKVHFTAEVHLARQPLTPPTISFAPPEADAMPITAAEIYNIYFHGPAYKVLQCAQVDGAQAVGLMPNALPPNTSPAAAAIMAPRLIELCFQTAGIWEIQTKGALALPLAIGSVTTYRQAADANGRRLYALVEAINDGETFDAQVVDEGGRVYVSVTGYRTVRLPGSVNSIQ